MLFEVIVADLPFEMLRDGIAEAHAKGYLGDHPFGTNHALDVRLYRGHGAYICGEETALLESLEGKRGEPRLKPPFPAQRGVFGCPTTVNNLETIAAVPTVIEMGGEAFSKLSALHHLNDGGSRLFGVSGHVKKPGIYEACVGLTLRELIFELGGGKRSALGWLEGAGARIARENLVAAFDGELRRFEVPFQRPDGSDGVYSSPNMCRASAGDSSSSVGTSTI